MNSTSLITPPAKRRILIVDDEAGFTRMVKRALESTGQFEVREENLSLDAVSAARRFKPDLILLDVIMPAVDGGDVSLKLSQDVFLREIPIVFLTATVSHREAGANGLSSGGNLFLAKPIDLDTLLRCINDTIHIHQV